MGCYFMKWQLKQIDAWADLDGGWNYNESWEIRQVTTENPEKELMNLIQPSYRKNYYTENIGCYPDVIELREKNTDRPIYCLELVEDGNE